MPTIERDIIIDTGRQEPGDENLFFGPNPGPVEHLDAETTWPDLLVPLVFSSKGQCRKAGFLEIPDGWTDRSIGKLKHRFCIWKS